MSNRRILDLHCLYCFKWQRFDWSVSPVVFRWTMKSLQLLQLLIPKLRCVHWSLTVISELMRERTCSDLNLSLHLFISGFQTFLISTDGLLKQFEFSIITAASLNFRFLQCGSLWSILASVHLGLLLFVQAWSDGNLEKY